MLSRLRHGAASLAFMKNQTILGLVLFGVLLLPPVIRFLESVMILHMLVQMPLLILSGWLLGQAVIRRFSRFFATWNDHGVPGILLVMIVSMYWMIPRAMDDTLTIWYVEVFKFISLPFLAGMMLRDSWRKLGMIGRSFVALNYLPMFGLMAWLYIDSPIQICNNYLENEQKDLGKGFLVVTLWMVAYILHFAFIDHRPQSEQQPQSGAD